MRYDKFDDNEWQFYLIVFLLLLFLLIFYVAVEHWWIRSPDLETDKGKCEAFCAGLGKELLGHGKRKPLDCFCEYPPTPVDKMLLKRP